MKTILTCAITGAHTTKKSNPNLPVTPQEIADSALESAAAGASIVHLHVRDPETAGPSMKFEYYQEVVERIRSQNSGVLINLTTGPGAAGPAASVRTGSDSFLSPEERVRHVVLLRPEICSLDFNTMNRGPDHITVNSVPVIREMAKLIQQAGVKPELEIFDSGDMMIAKDLLDRGEIEEPPMVQIATGVKWGWPSCPETLHYARSILPSNAVWYAFGVGRWQMPYVALSTINGGHARVGLEDNIFVSPRVLARSNAELVTKAKRIIEDVGGQLANPQETRNMLGIS
jgi:uncharacterized protein (DUF849 family)